MRDELWSRVTAVASRQHGLISGVQLRDAGCSPRCLERALGRKLLVGVRRGVFAVAGLPPSVWQPLQAACLAAGPHVVASHRAAAGLHEFPGVLPGAVELTSLYGRPVRLAGVRSHATSTVVGDEVVDIDGFRATSAARTVVDMAGVLSGQLLSKVVDFSLRRKLCSLADLERHLLQLGGRGRPGTSRLRRIVSERVGGDSGLEDRWLRLLKRAGLAPPALQHQLVVGGRILLLDFAWPALRLGVEVDGWEVHRDRSTWDHDHDKINAYLEAGWRVLFVTSNTAEQATLRQLRLFMSQKSPPERG